MPSTLWIAIAIIAVIIIRRFSRLVGSSLGLLTSFMLAGWGVEISRAIAKRRHPPHPVGIDTDDEESPPADDDPK